MSLQTLAEFGLNGVLLVAALEQLHGFRSTTFDGFKIGEDQLELNNVDIARGIDGTIHVDDVLVFEAANNVNDCIYFADMRKELVAQTFAAAGALDETGDVNELDGSRSHLFGLIHFRQNIQTGVGNGYNARVGLDGAEGIIGSLRACAGDGVEQGALAYIGKTNNTKFQSKHFLSTNYFII